MSSNPEFSEKIVDTPFGTALSDRYLAYALSTIMSRSLPDVRDGLKPVHRRLLWAMRLLKLDPKMGYKKCARVVGDVIGKYHPHGDQSVYDAMVRLAQDFSVRYQLVDGQGNFGNIDGDNAAAMRYTEARLTAVAALLMDGLDEDAVDFRETYDGEEEEPIVFPGAFPNLLGNGSAGIAVGMATSIPPHNIGELIDACQMLIDVRRDPTKNCSTKMLVRRVQGPDFPTGGICVENEESIINSYETGKGSFRLRARWEEEDQGRGSYLIVVTEIPYQVQKSKLIEKIAELIADKKLPILSDVRDESTEEVRVVIEPRNRNVEPKILMESLFKLTDLEIRFSLNMNVITTDNTPRVVSLRDALEMFLDHQLEVLVRKSQYRLDKIDRRLEILSGYMIAYLNLDEIIRIIREEDDAKIGLMETFKLTEVQAEAILNMRLRSLRKLEEVELKTEYDKLSGERSGLIALLDSADLQWISVGDALAKTKGLFGPDTDIGKRRTTFAEAPATEMVPIEAMIDKEPITILCSKRGWIRSMSGHVKDDQELKYKEGDEERFRFHAQTTDKILMFATSGKMFTLGADKLPGGRGHGEPVRLMVDMDNNDEIIELLPYVPGSKLFVASNIGKGFVAEADNVIAMKKGGKQLLNVKDDVVATHCLQITAQHDSVAIIGDNRKLLIYALEEVPSLNRGQGVALQKYKQGGMADITLFHREEGLSWPMGGDTGRTRTETELQVWVGKRAGAGRLPPTGFPRNNKFNG